MLKGLIGFVLGMTCGAFTIISFANGDSYLIFWIIFDVIVLATFLFWCYRYHIKKRNEHYDKIRGRFKYKG
jgi:hypothetical protein